MPQPVYRLGATGPAVAEIRSRLAASWAAAARPERRRHALRLRRRHVRSRGRPGGTRLPAAARGQRRRHRRPPDLAAARRRALESGRPGPRSSRCRTIRPATTSRSSSSDCSTWASTPVESTGSSAARPSARYASSSGTSASPTTAPPDRQHSRPWHGWRAPSAVGHRMRCGRTSRCAAAVPAWPARSWCSTRGTAAGAGHAPGTG